MQRSFQASPPPSLETIRNQIKSKLQETLKKKPDQITQTERDELYLFIENPKLLDKNLFLSQWHGEYDVKLKKEIEELNKTYLRIVSQPDQ